MSTQRNNWCWCSVVLCVRRKLALCVRQGRVLLQRGGLPATNKAAPLTRVSQSNNIHLKIYARALWLATGMVRSASGAGRSRERSQLI